MRKKILVIQHVESEGPGIIGEESQGAGLLLDYVRVYKGEKIPHALEDHCALIIMGGPMGVYEEAKYPFIKDEVALIERAFGEETPVMGVCLGAQMMARAAGARVFSGGVKEIGFYKIQLTDEGLEDELLTGLPREFTVFQWHGDTFDIPEGAANLASSELFAHQLIRVGKNSYGFQFHFEVTLPMVREFLDVNREELEGVKETVDPEEILREAPEILPMVHTLGRQVIKRFLKGIG